MRTVILENTLDVILNGIREYFEAIGTDTRIEINRLTDTVDHRRNVYCGVNWTGYGTTTPEKTFMFAEALKVAANIAETINAKNWKVKLEDGCNDVDKFERDVFFIRDGLLNGEDLNTLIDYIM